METTATTHSYEQFRELPTKEIAQMVMDNDQTRQQLFDALIGTRGGRSISTIYNTTVNETMLTEKLFEASSIYIHK
jgi:hypothetical protein